MPVALQRQQTLREAFAECVADEVAAVLAQDFGYVLVRIPAECVPHELVHVIVGAFGVTDEPDGVRLEETKDARLFDGPRIDAFPRRLGPRYLKHNPRFVWEICGQ